MTTKKRLTSFSKIILISYMLSLPVMANAITPGKITASGKAEILIPQTIATIQISITENAKTAQAVSQQINLKANTLLTALKATNNLGIETSSIAINPNWVFSNNQQKQDGFSGVYTIQVKAKIADVGRIIDTAFSSGATTINPPQLSADKTERSNAEQEAIKIAATNAKAHADAALAALGIKAKSIKEINVINNFNPPSPIYRMSLKDTNNSQTATPIEAGKETVSAEVNLSIEY